MGKGWNIPSNTYFRRMNKSYVAGICGGSATGKSSFMRDLYLKMPRNSVCIISQDNYYLPVEEQQLDENKKINFDLPTSINREAFHHDLHRLLSGETVQISEYTFNNPNRQPALISLEPAPIIVIEGLYIFYFEEIRKMLDLKIYLDARDEVKLQRRLKRDMEERGYMEESVLYQWHHHVMPSYLRYLKPHRDNSDLIIPTNVSYEKGLDVLVNHFKFLLKNFFNRNPEFE